MLDGNPNHCTLGQGLNPSLQVFSFRKKRDVRKNMSLAERTDKKTQKSTLWGYLLYGLLNVTASTVGESLIFVSY